MITIKDGGYIISLQMETSDDRKVIDDIMKSKPIAPNGYDYRLKEDMTWELYELPIEDEIEE